MKDNKGQTQLVNPPEDQTTLKKSEEQPLSIVEENKKLKEELAAMQAKLDDAKIKDEAKPPGKTVKMKVLSTIRYPMNDEWAKTYEPGSVIDVAEEDVAFLTKEHKGNFDFIGERIGKTGATRHVHKRAEVVG